MTTAGDILPNVTDYQTFEEFYPFYLSQHANLTCRRLHVIGSTLAILQLIRCLLIGFTLVQFLLVFVIGYGIAWDGHYIFEKNRPATFKYPLFSLQGDFRLLYETYTGQRKFWSFQHQSKRDSKNLIVSSNFMSLNFSMTFLWISLLFYFCLNLIWDKNQ